MGYQVVFMNDVLSPHFKTRQEAIIRRQQILDACHNDPFELSTKLFYEQEEFLTTIVTEQKDSLRDVNEDLKFVDEPTTNNKE